MKVRDILNKLGKRALPLVEEGETIEGVVQKMFDHWHTRLVYVVDKDGKFEGTISLGILIRHLFPHGFEPAIHPRSIISMITAETAKDIMSRRMINATEEDDVEDVIKRMIRAGVKEIAVVNKENKIVGDITMLDLLKYYVTD